MVSHKVYPEVVCVPFGGDICWNRIKYNKSLWYDWLQFQCLSINITIVIMGKGRYLNIILQGLCTTSYIQICLWWQNFVILWDTPKTKQKALVHHHSLGYVTLVKGYWYNLLGLCVLIFTKRAIYNPKVHNRASIQWVKAVPICSGMIRNWTWLIGPTRWPMWSINSKIVIYRISYISLFCGSSRVLLQN